MGQQRISFHLAKPDSSHLFPTFYRLVRQNVVGALSARLTFIRNHVSESLIIDETHEDVDLHHFTLNARIHRLVAIVVVPVLRQLLPIEVNHVVILVLLKGRHVYKFAVKSTALTCKTLNEHTNGHARGKSVRVDNNVGSQALFGERHIFLRPNDTEYALLPVPRTEFVTDDWIARIPYRVPDRPMGRIFATFHQPN